MNVGVKVDEVSDKVEDIGGKVEDMDDKVQCIGEKVQAVIDGAGGLSGQWLKPSNTILPDGKQVSVAAQETKLVIQQAASDIDRIKCS